MSNRKRGFVFYFDNILAVESLPPDQRGWLLSALCSYADRVWQDTSVGIEEVLDLYPQLSQQASVACRFLAAGVLRDTQKWLAQQELRTRRREQQGRAPLAARPASPVQDSPQSLERYRQDVELARRVLEESRREDESNYDELTSRIDAYIAEFEQHGTDNILVDLDTP